MKKILTILGILFIGITCSLRVVASYCATERPDVQTYIDQLVQQHHFDRDNLEKLFCTVTLDEEVIAKITKPAEAKPWYLYRELFITQDRIQKGVAFWQENQKSLTHAEKKYGVPASIIVAIIGVETKYGENKGKFPVFNTLVTLGFNGGRRENFFRSELTQYLLLARENNFPPLALKGSYAGALGLPQFMPSSYRQYAVDFYNKGRSDLFENNDDAIGSVANYLHKHGWKTGEPVALPATVEGNEYIALLQEKKFKPSLFENDLTRYGVTPSEPLNNRKATFFRLENQDGFEHWLGLQNFYVISTYNGSELYVMAVNELAKKIREASYYR